MARGLSTPALITLVIVVIVAAAGGLGTLYWITLPGSAPSQTVVALGDNVTVNYVGAFSTGPDAGKVFDTSLYAIATNNAQYPKSLMYQPRGPPANYTPLGVYVGAGAPANGYQLGGQTFVGVVPGFWQGLVGAPPNQTRTIVVPPSAGYGPQNPACLRTLPLVQHAPVLLTLNAAQFAKAYPGVTPYTGLVFNDPHLGWSVLVLSTNASFVALQNMPYVGETSSPSGWPVVVTAIAPTANGTGDITLVNQLSPSQAGLILGTDYLGTGPCSTQAKGKFIVSAIDAVAGTYTENFNPEVTGQTLVFYVSVINIFPPGTVG